MMMPNRSYSATSSYRYGFNGKENDNEVHGGGNQIDYGMRVYDPRIGRFLSVDPLIKKYPELTPYQFASNTPIQAVDLDGAESMFGWSMGMKPGQASEVVKAWTEHDCKIINGTASGVKKSVVKTWGFITSDAWKASTWKNLGSFIEEGALDMSAVKIAPSPRIDAAVQNLKEKVINGDAFSRSEYIAEGITDILTAEGVGRIKPFTVLKGMSTVEKVAARTNFARAFYEHMGGNVRDVAGINLTKEVSEIAINSKTKLYQWTIDGKLGDYFSSTADAKNLGLPQMPDGTPAYFDRTTNTLKPRKLMEIQVPDNVQVRGLKTTAGDIKPWDGSPGMNKGGDAQIYAPQVKTSGAKVSPVNN